MNDHDMIVSLDVTLVKDATADYADELIHAALVANLPNYANAIVTTNEIVDAISSLSSGVETKVTRVA